MSEHTPEAKLWRAVVTQAVIDASKLCEADGLKPDHVFPVTDSGVSLIEPNFRDHHVMPLWRFYVRLAEAALP